MNQIHKLRGQQVSIRAIGRRLGLARNTVRKYLRVPGVSRITPRPARRPRLALPPHLHH